ncbi:hypothetical protein LINPERHAP1_LOCUS38068 [Linum perenne]
MAAHRSQDPSSCIRPMPHNGRHRITRVRAEERTRGFVGRMLHEAV